MEYDDSFGHEPNGKEAHLLGDITKFESLPHGQKVDKIIIQYMGDYVFKGIPVNRFDWSFLRRLRNILNNGGELLLELRVNDLGRGLGIGFPEENIVNVSIQNINIHDFLDSWSPASYTEEEKKIATTMFTEMHAIIAIPDSVTGDIWIKLDDFLRTLTGQHKKNWRRFKKILFFS